ncbi:unnamed protein product, partial [Ixodes pacificus]
MSQICRLVFGLMAISMFLSMWINNVAITAMMMPVVDSLSKELLCRNTDDDIDQADNELVGKLNIILDFFFLLRQIAHQADAVSNSLKLAQVSDEVAVKIVSRIGATSATKALKSRIRVLLYLSVIYGANTGAITTITSAASNIVFKFVVEDEYEGRAPVDYATWLFFALPITLISTALIYILVVPLFFRCRRPNLDSDGGSAALDAIRSNYAALGPIRQVLMAVLVLFTLLIFLWLFRDPMFARGWATYFNVTEPKDATAVMIAVVLLFVIPAEPKKLTSSPGLVTWKVVQAKLQWSVILLIGSGFAIAEAMRVS